MHFHDAIGFNPNALAAESFNLLKPKVAGSQENRDCLYKARPRYRPDQHQVEPAVVELCGGGDANSRAVFGSVRDDGEKRESVPVHAVDLRAKVEYSSSEVGSRGTREVTSHARPAPKSRVGQLRGLSIEPDARGAYAVSDLAAGETHADQVDSARLRAEKRVGGSNRVSRNCECPCYIVAVSGGKKPGDGVRSGEGFDEVVEGSIATQPKDIRIASSGGAGSLLAQVVDIPRFAEFYRASATSKVIGGYRELPRRAASSRGWIDDDEQVALHVISVLNGRD